MIASGHPPIRIAFVCGKQYDVPMKSGRPHLRFRLKSDADMPGRYSVIDIFTGAPVVIYGRPMFWLPVETADELAEVLNHQDVLRREKRKPTQ
jgi:hypothetical protein